MSLILHSWRRMWQSVAFDTSRGIGHIRWLSRAPTKSAGWAFKHAGAWYAIWNNGLNLVFQAGDKKLPMVEAYQCTNEIVGTRRRFAVSEHGKALVEVTYTIHGNGDPTFDDADLEQCDFFVYVSRLWNDMKWKQEVVENWSPFQPTHLAPVDRNCK